MGAGQSLPVIGEVLTVAESASKTVAAGACAVAGHSDAAGELIKGAGDSWVSYSERSCVVANINMLVAKVGGDQAKVERLKEMQAQAWTDLGENMPAVGHVIGVVRYATGDAEGGSRCMIGASRTTAIIAAAASAGGGPLAAGAIIAGAGVFYDGIATGINSAANGEFKPVGMVQAVDTAVKTGDPNDVFNAFAMPLGDFAAGLDRGE